LLLPEIEASRPVRSLVTILTELPRLLTCDPSTSLTCADLLALCLEFFVVLEQCAGYMPTRSSSKSYVCWTWVLYQNKPVSHLHLNKNIDLVHTAVINEPVSYTIGITHFL